MEITLRNWELADVDQLAIIANNKNIADFLTNHFPHPYSKQDALTYIEMVSKPALRNIQAIDVNGQAIGSIGIHPQGDIFLKNAELGYWLAESYWGKGIMSKAVNLMTSYAFNNWEINRVFARPFHSNIGSQKVLEKCNYKFEARLERTIFKNNEYLDEMIYSIRRKDYNFTKAAK